MTELSKELETYEELKPELLDEAEGKFVLIKDEELFGTFDSQRDAVRAGYQRFGNVPFLVKKVVAVEVPETVVSTLFDG